MHEERDASIERLLRQGTPKVQVARRLGIARDTVDRVAARIGLPNQRRGSDGHDWTAIRAYYEDGHTAAACQRRYGFTAATWEAAIGRGEIVPRPRNTQLPPGRRRRQVAELLEQGMGVGEIAKRLGISTPTACYHARKLGVPAQAQFARRFDWAEIQGAYDSGVAMRECKRRFGFSSHAWADAVKRGDIVPRGRLIPLSGLLVRGRRTSRGHLKARLVDAGLKENRCERCGIDTVAWGPTQHAAPPQERRRDRQSAWKPRISLRELPLADRYLRRAQWAPPPRPHEAASERTRRAAG